MKKVFDTDKNKAIELSEKIRNRKQYSIRKHDF